MRHEIQVGSGEAARRIAVLARAGTGPQVIWFGGFRSEMTGTKAEAIDAWAAEAGRAYLRFDYSGHGQSGGRFEDGTISRWLDDALAVLDRFGEGHGILVGSSMGGWMALLAAKHLLSADRSKAPAALVLLAPAPDFTEELMWNAASTEVRETILRDGVHFEPSDYSADPTPITRSLIEDGRRHLLLGSPIETGCPVRIIQGMQDPDVPWDHAMRLVERLPAESVQLTLVKDGDHRLSRPQDLALMMAAIRDAAGAASPADASDPQLRLTV